MYTRDNNTCEEFENVIKDLTINPTVQKMKEFRQHYNTSCYEHCLNVAFYSYLIAKKLNLDYKSYCTWGNVTRLVFVRLETQ